MQIKLGGQEDMASGFIDLEIPDDTIQRQVETATLRWMGIPEAEVRMVYKTKSRMLCELKMSEEFR